jgi:hypothetical protein
MLKIILNLICELFDRVLTTLNFYFRGIFVLLFFVYTKYTSQTGTLSVCNWHWRHYTSHRL